MRLACAAILLSRTMSARPLFRPDGVKITHDPFAPDIMEKYGLPGRTDDEGFDPYADTVGPGIYGGIVKRDAAGAVVIGRQYQDHNPVPGPVYAGGGYTPTSRLLSAGDPAALSAWLDRFPDLANEVSTGGATPLHVCGMSRAASRLAALVAARGGRLEAVDTYGFRPLHRMASNNLAEGARARFCRRAPTAARARRAERRRSTLRARPPPPTSSPFWRGEGEKRRHAAALAAALLCTPHGAPPAAADKQLFADDAVSTAALPPAHAGPTAHRAARGKLRKRARRLGRVDGAVGIVGARGRRCREPC